MIALCLFSSPTLDPFWSSRSFVFEFFPHTLISLHFYIEKISWWKVWLRFIFLVLSPFIPCEAPTPWHSGFFPQTLISFHFYTKKTSWWRTWSRFVFSIFMPFIPFEPPAPYHSKIFPKTLISFHSYIEITFWWKVQLHFVLFQEKTKTHTPTQSCQLPKPPHCSYWGFNIRLDASYATWQCWFLVFYLGLLLNPYGILLSLIYQLLVFLFKGLWFRV